MDARRLTLIAITDPDCGGRDLGAVVRAALSGGAPAVQIRAKNQSGREMVELARSLKAETERAGALLFINDRVDVALAAGADGAHLGQDDLPVADARRLAPPGFLLGCSAETPEQAREAEQAGADYVGVGPVFATASKLDAGRPLGLEGIAQVRSATSLPLIAIGGIDAGNAAAVTRAGAAGIAVIRAVMQATNPDDAVRELLQRANEGIAARG